MSKSEIKITMGITIGLPPNLYDLPMLKAKYWHEQATKVHVW